MPNVYTNPNSIIENFYKAATVDLTVGYFVVQTADDKITPVTAATDKAIGLLLDDSARVDVKCRVMLCGVAYALAGGTVTRGYHLIMTTAGAVTNASYANAERIVGVALDSGSSGGWVKILVLPQGMPAS